MKLYSICPKCTKTTEFIGEINGFMCGNCNILFFNNNEIIEIPKTEVLEE